MLLNSDTEYREYFDWYSSDYALGKPYTLNGIYDGGMCAVCKGVHLAREGTLVQPAVPDLQTWWYGRRDSISPDMCKDENVV